MKKIILLLSFYLAINSTQDIAGQRIILTEDTPWHVHPVTGDNNASGPTPTNPKKHLQNTWDYSYD